MITWKNFWSNIQIHNHEISYVKADNVNWNVMCHAVSQEDLETKTLKDLMLEAYKILTADSVFLMKELILFTIIGIIYHAWTLKAEKVKTESIYDHLVKFYHSLLPFSLGSIKTILSNRTIVLFLIINLFGVFPLGYYYFSSHEVIYFIILCEVTLIHFWVIWFKRMKSVWNVMVANNSKFTSGEWINSFIGYIFSFLILGLRPVVNLTGGHYLIILIHIGHPFFLYWISNYQFKEGIKGLLPAVFFSTLESLYSNFENASGHLWGSDFLKNLTSFKFLFNDIAIVSAFAIFYWMGVLITLKENFKTGNSIIKEKLLEIYRPHGPNINSWLNNIFSLVLTFILMSLSNKSWAIIANPIICLFFSKFLSNFVCKLGTLLSQFYDLVDPYVGNSINYVKIELKKLYNLLCINIWALFSFLMDWFVGLSQALQSVSVLCKNFKKFLWDNGDHILRAYFFLVPFIWLCLLFYWYTSETAKITFFWISVFWLSLHLGVWMYKHPGFAKPTCNMSWLTIDYSIIERFATLKNVYTNLAFIALFFVINWFYGIFDGEDLQYVYVIIVVLALCWCSWLLLKENIQEVYYFYKDNPFWRDWQFLYSFLLFWFLSHHFRNGLGDKYFDKLIVGIIIFAIIWGMKREGLKWWYRNLIPLLLIVCIINLCSYIIINSEIIMNSEIFKKYMPTCFTAHYFVCGTLLLSAILFLVCFYFSETYKDWIKIILKNSTKFQEDLIDEYVKQFTKMCHNFYKPKKKLVIKLFHAFKDWKNHLWAVYLSGLGILALINLIFYLHEYQIQILITLLIGCLWATDQKTCKSILNEFLCKETINRNIENYMDAKKKYINRNELTTELSLILGILSFVKYLILLLIFFCFSWTTFLFFVAAGIIIKRLGIDVKFVREQEECKYTTCRWNICAFINSLTIMIFEGFMKILVVTILSLIYSWICNANAYFDYTPYLVLIALYTKNIIHLIEYTYENRSEDKFQWIMISISGVIFFYFYLLFLSEIFFNSVPILNRSLFILFFIYTPLFIYDMWGIKGPMINFLYSKFNQIKKLNFRETKTWSFLKWYVIIVLFSTLVAPLAHNSEYAMLVGYWLTLIYAPFTLIIMGIGWISTTAPTIISYECFVSVVQAIILVLLIAVVIDFDYSGKKNIMFNKFNVRSD